MTVGATTPWPRQRADELALAFALLTRLPVPRLPLATGYLGVADYVWAFPLAGLTVGALGAVAHSLASLLGVPPALAALIAIAVTLLASGALHEDGLADFWDGIGGGRTRERKLEIMRDSSIGSYGAAALFLVLAARWAALSSLTDPRLAAGALVVTHATARGMLAIVLEFWRPARKDGLTAAQGGTWVRSAVAIGFTAAIAAAYAAPPVALAVLLAGALAVVAVAVLAGRYLGGYTGDALGAAEQAAEAAVLVALATALAH